MDAIEMIKERRSVRNFKNEKVDRGVMREVVEIARWAPSWANYQVARYTLIDDAAIIEKLAHDGVKGFVYNMNTLKNAKGVAVLSFVQGKSGKLDLEKEEYATSKANVWEVFDAGLSCQTFCLAAHLKGIGTCILGVIDDETTKNIVGLPEKETVAALIVYGYEEGDHVKPTARKEVDEILRFVDA